MAAYCFLNNNLLPSQYIQLPQKERAFIIACVQEKLDKEKKENAKIKANSNARRRK